jgi:peptide/nickel transport system permease protein
MSELAVTMLDAEEPVPERNSRTSGAAVYFLGRVGQGVLVLFGAVTASFIIIHLTGNPATVLVGTSMPPAAVHVLSEKLGYNRPILDQYGTYIWHVLQGNFGVSIADDTPAMGVVMKDLPYTLMLVGISLTSAMLIASAVAISSVLRVGAWGDRLWRPVLIAFQGIPDFWIGLIAVFVLSVKLHWLSSIGFNGPSSLIMPCLALTLPIVASFTRLLRGSLLDFMGSDVVLSLSARGMTRREIVLHHGVRNAMTTFVSFVALQIGWLIGGTLVVETIFAWPGIGSLLYDSVEARDLTVVQAVVVVIAFAFVVLNLVADLVVLWLDPRIGRGSIGGST